MLRDTEQMCEVLRRDFGIEISVGDFFSAADEDADGGAVCHGFEFGANRAGTEAAGGDLLLFVTGGGARRSRLDFAVAVDSVEFRALEVVSDLRSAEKLF